MNKEIIDRLSNAKTVAALKIIVSDNISYTEYLVEQLNKYIQYTEYLCDNLDMSMAYADMLAEKIREIAPDFVVPDVKSWIEDQKK